MPDITPDIYYYKINHLRATRTLPTTPNSPNHPPCHDVTPYSPYPLFSQLPYRQPTVEKPLTLQLHVLASPTHPPLQHFPLQPWPPSALPRHHTHHTPSRHVSPLSPRRLSHCCSQALATPIIAKPRARPQGCQRRSSSLRRSFPSLLGPLAPEPTHSSSSRGP